MDEESRSRFDRALEYALEEVERVGNPERLPPAVRTVVLVHAAQGIIDNGGLQYLFEEDFPRRPPYAVFIDAYRAIGAEDAAGALAEAVALFPFLEPHRKRKRRVAFLEELSESEERGEANPMEALSDRLCGNAEAWRRLESYVERHAAAFPV